MFDWSTLTSRQKVLAISAWSFLLVAVLLEYHWASSQLSSYVKAAGRIALIASYTLNPRLLDWGDRHAGWRAWPRWCIGLMLGAIATLVVGYALRSIGM